MRWLLSALIMEAFVPLERVLTFLIRAPARYSDLASFSKLFGLNFLLASMKDRSLLLKLMLKSSLPMAT